MGEADKAADRAQAGQGWVKVGDHGKQPGGSGTWARW